ncbi:hypothetical protein BDP81DRAFT_421367 [Colletotrichum phormii]|uniref:Uncharacterized protein n=1 Tax=Colletotrichum phormii TaxID=359342 RepID=A0AAI9ZZ43_9PEZI|nr:uncharacterized protein BDP81DRAFT_421367 [Colletotrichum phormii]KAK1639588.1 hypothetical protein BDP81DRAFT_421367 [Colletotrichum phormii]
MLSPHLFSDLALRLAPPALCTSLPCSNFLSCSHRWPCAPSRPYAWRQRWAWDACCQSQCQVFLVRSRGSGAVESSIVMVLDKGSRGSDFYGTVSNTDATTSHPTSYDKSYSTASKESAKHPVRTPYRVSLYSSGKVWSLIVRGRIRMTMWLLSM